MVPQKGGPCGLLASSMLRRCFLLDFGASEPTLDDNLSPLTRFGLIFSLFLGSRFHIWERGLGANEPTLDHNLSLLPKFGP